MSARQNLDSFVPAIMNKPKPKPPSPPKEEAKPEETPADQQPTSEKKESDMDVEQ